jgi:hypothetical protein
LQVTHVAFSRDGKRLAILTGVPDYRLIVWSVVHKKRRDEQHHDSMEAEARSEYIEANKWVPRAYPLVQFTVPSYTVTALHQATRHCSKLHARYYCMLLLLLPLVLTTLLLLVLPLRL